MEPPYLPRLLADELGLRYHELPMLKVAGASSEMGHNEPVFSV
jgi:hypothetical protein